MFAEWIFYFKKKNCVAGVSYAFGQSEYTYITGSSNKTVLDPSRS